jgi:hypothetical protein
MAPGLLKLGLAKSRPMAVTIGRGLRTVVRRMAAKLIAAMEKTSVFEQLALPVKYILAADDVGNLNFINPDHHFRAVFKLHRSFVNDIRSQTVNGVAILNWKMLGS